MTRRFILVLQAALFAIALFILVCHVTAADDAIVGSAPPTDPNAVRVEGAPLSAVVITSCNGIVAVYMTTRAGLLVRFDASSGVKWQDLLTAAYAADHSERIEVGCDHGVVGTERHHGDQRT